MFTKLLLLLFFISFIEARTTYNEDDHIRRFAYGSPRVPCKVPYLENGKARLRQRWRMVRYACSIGYHLVGNRYATCRDGEWDEPIPVCVQSGCDIPKVENGVVLRAYDDAWLHMFCLSGYILKGSAVLYCNGRRWNGTAPECLATAVKPKLSCDFEYADLCGWTQDEFHDFDWKRLNKKTPSSFLFTGPSYDHTYGPGKDGYYMYIESTSKEENQTARLLSPIYSADVAYGACFVFYYHMYGKDIGGLRVYQKPDNVPLGTMLNSSVSDRRLYVLFELWGNQDNFWYGSVTSLKNFSDEFQIVIEGIRGSSFTSDIAIDDVSILYGENCTETAKTISTPSSLIPETCEGRCDVFGEKEGALARAGCGCTVMCLLDDNCCPDFLELCAYHNNSKQDESTILDENTTAELPQTQKLVGFNTTVTTSTPSNSTVLVNTASESTTTTTRKPLPSTSPYWLFIRRKTTEPIIKLKETTTSTSTTSSTAHTTTTSTSTTSTTTTTTARPETTSTTTTATTSATIKPIISTSITKIPVTVTKVFTKSYTKAVTGNANANVTTSKNLKAVSNKSGWGAVQILITAICLGCLCGLVYAVIALRSSRGRLYIARMRGSVREDPEVRYLSSHVDDD